MADVREHPDYERGYSDRWRGKNLQDSTPEYCAGYGAAGWAEDAFRKAGFVKVGGIWTKSETTLPETPEAI